MKPELAVALRKAAKDALLVQDAVNLSGVVRDFSEILQNVLWPVARELGKGTDWVNRHPISMLFSDKISDLALRHADVEALFPAYDACRALADHNQPLKISGDPLEVQQLVDTLGAVGLNAIVLDDESEANA